MRTVYKLMLGVAMAACGSVSAQDFTYTGSVVDFTVPTTGIYDIVAEGAGGGMGDYGTFGGAGAAVGGDLFLTVGTQLDLVIGGQGQSGAFGPADGGGGGGGSFVFVPGSLNPLLVAGGGGGASYEYLGCPPSINCNGGSGQITRNGQSGLGPDGGAGGVAGSGGAGGSTTMGSNGGGGGGWFGNGTAGAGGTTAASGNGGSGPASFAGGDGSGCPNNTPSGCTNGGFGGGGAGGFNSGGGGGGYSGGGGGGVGGVGYEGGGGGGSYIDATFTNAAAISGANSGNGQINIAFVSKANAAPEIDSTSAASGLVLLVSGLLVLRGRKRQGVIA